MKVKRESEVAQLCPTLSEPIDISYQAPLSMGFSRQECWSGVPLPSLNVKLREGLSLVLYGNLGFGNVKTCIHTWILPFTSCSFSGRLCNSLSVSSSLKEGSLFISHGTVIKIKLEFSSMSPGIILILVTVHNPRSWHCTLHIVSS